uniref:Uncharacterized protein n=1 Tax=Anguilla anguilla TaxID=7936 RepID=A0A0E9RIA3_ANGAN
MGFFSSHAYLLIVCQFIRRLDCCQTFTDPNHSGCPMILSF